MLKLLFILPSCIILLIIIYYFPLQFVIEWNYVKKELYQRFSLKIFNKEILNQKKKIKSFQLPNSNNPLDLKKNICSILKNKTIKQNLEKIRQKISLYNLYFISEIGFESPIQTSLAISPVWMLKSFLLQQLWKNVHIHKNANIEVKVEPNFNEKVVCSTFKTEGKIRIKDLVHLYSIFKSIYKKSHCKNE